MRSSHTAYSESYCWACASGTLVFELQGGRGQTPDFFLGKETGSCECPRREGFTAVHLATVHGPGVFLWWRKLQCPAWEQGRVVFVRLALLLGVVGERFLAAQRSRNFRAGRELHLLNKWRALRRLRVAEDRLRASWEGSESWWKSFQKLK